MRLFRKRSPPPGSAPGTLFISDEGASPATIAVTRYGPQLHESRQLTSLVELDDIDDSEVTWVDVDGLDVETITAVGARFGLHPLLLEDVVHVPQRPQVREYPGALGVITRMLQFDSERGLEAEQVTLILAGNTLISFQERSGDVFDPVRRRLLEGKGRLRHNGADYLLYALLDAVVDAYYPALEGIGDELESLEEAVMFDPRPDELRRITSLKGDLLAMRRAIWPQREALAVLARNEYEAIDSSLDVFFRDVLDHAVQSADVVESYRELASGLLNTYLTVVANKTNDVMKVLTIIASIFIPLTFMAGIYGMNFEAMPELKYRYGYPLLLGAMAVVAVVMTLWFRRRRWL